MKPNPRERGCLEILNAARDAIRRKDYSFRTEESYVYWIGRFIDFCDSNGSHDLMDSEMMRFLSGLMLEPKVSAASQNQAFSALQFLAKEVLGLSLPEAIHHLRAKSPREVPTIITPDEARAVFQKLSGVYQLLAQLFYGSGIRLSEGLQLRVQDINFSNHKLHIRDASGQNGRYTVLPVCLDATLNEHLQQVKRIHQQDLAKGDGYAFFPAASKKKPPRSSRKWAWQFVFPTAKLTQDSLTGKRWRNHIPETGLQRAIKQAAREAGIEKRVSCQTFRHSFASHLLNQGYSIQTVKELLGHKDIKTTMIYFSTLTQDRPGVRSPLDF